MIKKKFVFIGRLEKDTGVLEFLEHISRLDYGYTVDFVGDGELRKQCEKFGKVYGFTDPNSFYKKADIVVPSGYLSYIEAKSYGCKIMTFASNPLKEDYWDEIKAIKKFPSWDNIADEYIHLYNS